MFCNQCEQTSKGTACTVVGICGKKPEVAALQDLLTYAMRGLAEVVRALEQAGKLPAPEVDRLICEGLFATLTNVNFDPESLTRLIRRTATNRNQILAELSPEVQQQLKAQATVSFAPASDLPELVRQGEAVGAPASEVKDPDLASLQQIVVYGLRGVAAYAYHAAAMGQEDREMYDYVYEAMSALNNPALGGEEWLQLVIGCGKANLKAMELLDKGHTSRFGHPEPTAVKLGHRQGKCILVSGHDLPDLEQLLEQTQGTGINIYTHGEMLPAHGYPGLKRYPHLAGHFGTAWQNQKKEFAQFPGPILMTTNCIQEPQASYLNNIYTTGPVDWPGVVHVQPHDYSLLIKQALAMPGFAEDLEAGSVLCGFGREAVLSRAGVILEAVKSGAIRHFFLVGGCDGAKPGRNYYAEFVEKTPADTVVLTLACGKFRFFDKQLGDIGGIPRLLDVGQCNDAYSAIQIAVALANALECEVNDLPLSMVLSWYEQKAVSILLTLLYLGIKNIRLGPSLPAFVSPNVLQVLQQNFGLMAIGNVDEDLAAILQK